MISVGLGLLPCFTLSAQTLVLESRNGEPFQAWVDGKLITTDYTTVAETKAEPGKHVIALQMRGDAEPQPTDVITMPEEVSKMRWFVKVKSNGGVALNLDLAMYSAAQVKDAATLSEEEQKQKQIEETTREEAAAAEKAERDRQREEAAAEREAWTPPATSSAGTAGGDEPSASAPAVSNDGRIKFEWTFLDMGTFDQGQVTEYDLKFESTGDGPLVISGVTTSCFCMEAISWPRTPVPPGSRGVIRIRLTVPKSEGHNTEKVTVMANTFMGKDNVNLEWTATSKVVAGTAPKPTTPAPVTNTDKPAPTVTAPVFGSVKDNRDGETYKTVRIGGQEWFAENLRYKAERSYLHQDATDIHKYGYLYSWPAIIKETLCPVGWHVSTDADWKKLESVVTTAKGGEALKSESGWDGRNTYGMNVLPAGTGSRSKSGEEWQIATGDFGDKEIFWSPQPEPSGVLTTWHPFTREFGSYSDSMKRNELQSLSPGLYHCRCVRD